MVIWNRREVIDIPTPETLAAVDLMTLQPGEEHPHGLSDKDFDVYLNRHMEYM